MPLQVSLKSERVPHAMDTNMFLKYGGVASCHHSSFPDMRQVKSIDQLEAVEFAKRNISPFISPIMDSATLLKVVKDLGITGRVEARLINGRQVVVFGGYAGRRSLFRGTVYSARNAKILQMAIGALGIKNMVKAGARITILATVPLTIVECILQDKFTLANIIGHIAADLVKVAIGSLVGGLTGLFVGAVATTAVLPIFITIVVSVGAGLALETIDTHYGLTDKLVVALEKGGEAIARKKVEMEKSLGRKLHEMERELVYRAIGYDIDNPFQAFR